MCESVIVEGLWQRQDLSILVYTYLIDDKSSNIWRHSSVVCLLKVCTCVCVFLKVLHLVFPEGRYVGRRSRETWPSSKHPRESSKETSYHTRFPADQPFRAKENDAELQLSTLQLSRLLSRSVGAGVQLQGKIHCP